MREVANSNNRVVDVITFLSAHPTEAFTLSQLAERVGMSLGSAHRTLATLTEARFVARHPKHKTYTLGVALVAIGQSALEKHRSIEVARRELASLGVELRAQCTAAVVVDGEILILAREGAPRTHDAISRVGERRPFIPPLGLCHVAWASERELKAFLESAPFAPQDPRHAHLRRAVELVCARGYSIAGDGPTIRNLRQISRVPIGGPRTEDNRQSVLAAIASLSHEEIQLENLDATPAPSVSYISAPVFGPSGEVDLELTVSGLSSNMNSIEIKRCAEQLLATASRVTIETHGRLPKPFPSHSA